MYAEVVLKVLRFLRKVFFLAAVAPALVSCASTKFYSEKNVEIVSDFEDEEEAPHLNIEPESGPEDFSDSSIHYIETNRTVKSTCSTDVQLAAFYTFGFPWVVLGCTVRETVKVAAYSVLNAVSGMFAYYRLRDNKPAGTLGFILPDTKKEKKEYAQMMEEYRKSDLYRYKKYRKPLTKAEITDNIIVEEVYWNDRRKTVSSTTNTVSVRTSVSDSVQRISKKATITGSVVGSFTSIALGIPSWVLGFAAGIAYDRQ